MTALLTGLVEPFDVADESRNGPTWDDVLVTGVAMDSRLVRPGDLYVAPAGSNVHGAIFVEQVVAAGAVAVLTDAAGAALTAGTSVPVVVVDEPRAILGELAARAYGRPGDDLLLVGITGTNGKTTMSFLVEAALREAGHVTGLLGTTGHLVAGERLKSTRTTPEAPEVHALLGIMRDRGVTAVVMEVSSHALAFGRVNGLVFDVVTFTNLTQDHLDFHGDLQEYFRVKSMLFLPDRAQRAVVCIDDDWGRHLVDDAAIPVESYSVADESADWFATESAHSGTGSSFVICHGGGRLPTRVALPGLFNIANGVGALATAAAAGVPAWTAAAGIAACPGVPGRMEGVPGPGPIQGIVDYAHTPDAVTRAIEALADSAGRIVVVLGCGGDRDAAKRPIMGEVAARLADFVVITDDNPRSEDPSTIRSAIAQGAMSVPESLRATIEVVGDRAAAIARAVEVAEPQDVVLVLGKGHEQGQEIDGHVYSFDDRVALAQALDQGNQ